MNLCQDNCSYCPNAMGSYVKCKKELPIEKPDREDDIIPQTEVSNGKEN